MSRFDPFVKYGHHRGIIATRDAAPMFPGEVIEVVNIGIEGWVGLRYPDNARMATAIEGQPKEVQEAYRMLGKPVLKPRFSPPQKKPVLKHPAQKKPLLKRR